MRKREKDGSPAMKKEEEGEEVGKKEEKEKRWKKRKRKEGCVVCISKTMGTGRGQAGRKERDPEE